MKWIYLVLSYVAKWLEDVGIEKTNQQVEEFKQLIKENALKLILLFSAVSALGSFFVAGVCLSLVEMANQYYKGENFKNGSLGSIGAILIIISSLVYLTGLLYATKHNRKHHKPAPTKSFEKHDSTINDAIILLVNDYIAERELKREILRSQHEQAHTTHQDENEDPLKSADFSERH